MIENRRALTRYEIDKTTTELLSADSPYFQCLTLFTNPSLGRYSNVLSFNVALSAFS